MLGFLKERRLPIDFNIPEEGGDGSGDDILNEKQEGAIDLFAQETGEGLERYLNDALAMGSAAVSGSQNQES